MNVQQFDYSVNLLQALLWQYNEAPVLQSILSQKQAWYNENQTQFWSDWYDNVFNLLTANTFGLTVWARILNVPLFINLTPEPIGSPIFGFNTPGATTGNQNFGNGNFSYQGDIIFLSVEEQRFILRLRFYQLTSRQSPTEINEFLDYLLRTSDLPSQGFGRVWVEDNFNMTMTYRFTFTPNPLFLQVLESLDVLPRPAGVSYNIIVTTYTAFGFNTVADGTGNQNFGNGNFVPAH